MSSKQIRKAEIGKIFEKLKLDVRSTKHRHGWFAFKGRKIGGSIGRSFVSV